MNVLSIFNNIYQAVFNPQPKIYKVDIKQMRKICLSTGEEYVAILLEDRWWSGYIKIVYLMRLQTFVNEETLDVIRIRVNKIRDMIPIPFYMNKDSISYMSDISYDVAVAYNEMIKQENIRMEKMYSNVAGEVSTVKETDGVDLPKPTHEIEQEFMM
jgi:hypothetical protein